MIPSDKKIYSRMNPACFNAKIIVRNNGNQTITHLNIQYGTRGFQAKNFVWKGELKSGIVDTIQLPGEIACAKGQNTFQVNVSRVNDKRDVYPKDNQLVSDFQSPPRHGNELIFFMQTNKQANQNAYKLINAAGKVLYQRSLASLAPFTVYKDTFHLMPGNYQLQLIDTAGNGLEFWYDVDAGRGRAILLDSTGKIINAFLSDFGREVTYNFTVGADPDPVAQSQRAMGLFPTRTVDNITFDFLSNNPEKVSVQLVADPGGQVVEEHIYNNLKEATLTYSLRRYEKGRFYFKVFIGSELVFNKRVRLTDK